MSYLMVVGLNVLAALFNAALSIYITNSKQLYKDINLFVYFAFIISCGAIITDIIYCILY